MSMAFVAFGLAAVAPSGIKGFVGFLQAPPGLAVVALALMAIGLSVEETGTIRRIRLGVGMRLVAVPILVVAAFWAMTLGAPMPSLATMGLVFAGAGFVGVLIALQHDWGVYGDVRYGQPVRFVELTQSGVVIEAKGEQATVRMADILALRGAQNLDGRAIVFLVNEKTRERKNMELVPWVGATPEGDAFVLTEHQLGMDVELFMTQMAAMVAEKKPESKQ